MKHIQYLLRHPNGQYLSTTEGLQLVAGDDCIWFLSDNLLVSALDGKSLTSERQSATEITIQSTPSEAGNHFALEPAPERMPSTYLKELKEHGFTVLTNLLSAENCQRLRAAAKDKLKQQVPDEEAYDQRVSLPNGVAWSKEVCNAVTHPVALWLMQNYLGTPAIHYCHQPVVTALLPAKNILGTFPEDGWHSDYPYHRDVFPEDRWSDDQIYGLQFNICIDEFCADNAATQYVPGSHLNRDFPPRAFNQGGTRMGKGLHKDVKQMLAPAGSALVYDSRTWHRACEELNASGNIRVAVLNAVSPSWVRPMSDRTSGKHDFEVSGIAAALTERECQAISTLCHSPATTPPSGAPLLRAKVLKKV